MLDHDDSLEGETIDGERKTGGGKKSIGGGSTDDGGKSKLGEVRGLALGLPIIDFAARFEIVRELGQGGMGEVQLARCKVLHREVAIKRILGTKIRSSAAVKRFVTEAQSIAATNHNNIVRIYEFGQDADGAPLIVCEYVSGGNLLERLKKGRLDTEEAIKITGQLCDALTIAHAKGIIHRDIKPANILMTEDGVPKLTDFGLAKQLNTGHGQTSVGDIMGTIDYMAPEQRRDSSSVDERSDLWSLAAVCYEMVTGQSPKVMRERDMPENLRNVLMKALEDDPSQRFLSVAEFKEGLQQDILPKKKDLPLPIAEGVCPSCDSANDLVRKYCRVCGHNLVADCISCDFKIRVWEVICGECGTSQEEARNVLRTQFRQLLEDSKLLLVEFEFDKAEEALAEILECDYEFAVELVQDAKLQVENIRSESKAWEANLKIMLADALSHIGNYWFDKAEKLLKQIPRNASTPQVKEAFGKIQIGREQFEDLLEGLRGSLEADNLILLETQLPLVDELFARVKAARDTPDDAIGVSDELEMQLQQLYDTCVSTMDKASVSIQQQIAKCQTLIADGLPEEAEQCLGGVQCKWSMQIASELSDELSFIEKADVLRSYPFGDIHSRYVDELYELYSTCQLCLERWPNWKIVLEKQDLIIKDLSSNWVLTSELLSKYPNGSYAPIQLCLSLDTKALPEGYVVGIAQLRSLFAGQSPVFSSKTDLPPPYCDATYLELVEHATSLQENGELELAIKCVESFVFDNSSYPAAAGLKLRATLYKKLGDCDKLRAYQLFAAGSRALSRGAWWQARFLLIQSVGYDSHPHSLNSLAYLLAVAPTTRLVEPQLAVRIAELANAMTDGQNSHIVDTLACAYAATGDFSAAFEYSEKAVELSGEEEDIRSAAQISRDHILRSERVIARSNEEQGLETPPSRFVEMVTKGDFSWYDKKSCFPTRRISRQQIELTGAIVLLLIGVIALLTAIGVW